MKKFITLVSISLISISVSLAQCTSFPTITGSTPAARCSNGTVTLQATASAGANVAWYAAATGGVALSSAASYTTPTISATTTYYAEARLLTDNGTCVSVSRTPVVATINPIPTITIAPTYERCGPGTVNLSATASVTGSTIDWYSASAGGSSLGTGNTFTTPVINTSGTQIYLSATSPAGCIYTAGRYSTIILLNAIPVVTNPTAGSRCGTGTVLLNATQTLGTLAWHTLPTGGALVAGGNNTNSPTISTTTTFYVEAVTTKCTSSPRVSVVATVNPNPTVTGTGARRCGPGTVNLSATPSNGTVKWFSDFAGGAAIATGNTFTTPNLTTSKTYYLEVADALCTNPNRMPVSATIDLPPSGATATGATRCDSGVVVLTGLPSTTNSTINWYSSPTGGTVLGTGTSFTTPFNNITTTYYNDETNSLGCVSSPRVVAVATIQAVPSIISYANVSRCGTGSVLLTATPSSGGTIRWFSSAVEGAALLAGNSYTTPNLGITTTYYAQAQFSNSCFENTRVPITATIKPYPLGTYTLSGNVITATETDPGITYQWQTCTANPNIVGATAQSYTATTSNSYRLTLTLNGCYGGSACIPIVITGMEDESSNQSSFKIYPNPSNGDFAIEKSENATIDILNNSGQSILQIPSTEETYKVSGLSEGIYFVRIMSNGKITTKKILITK